VLAHPMRLVLGHFEHEFVVNLHHHAGAPLFSDERGVDGDHRHFDEIGRSALHGRVDRGTLGGSLAQADPAAELPACMIALDAIIVATGPGGERRIAAKDFFLGVYETALRPDEVLTRVEIGGLDPGRAYGFAELSRRRGDFAIVGLALAARRRATGLDDVRLVYFGVSDRPTPAPVAAAALARQDMEAARAALAADLDPVSDAQASAAMRLHLAGVLLDRAFAEATEAGT